MAFAERVKVNIVISGGIEAAGGAAAQGEEHPGDSRQRAVEPSGPEDGFHAATYQLAGRARAGRRQGRLLDGRQRLRAHAALHAGMSVAWGMNRDAAIKALTIDAAEILGVADRVGSLEAGQGREPVHRQGRPARDPKTR